MATIIDGKRRIPFMRGMLVHHLIQLGFDYDQAYLLADDVRAALREKTDVDKKEITRVIRQLLATHHQDQEVGDLVFWEPRPMSVTVGSRPFSREMLSNSIQASGLPADQSFEIARDIETQLIDRRRGNIPDGELQVLAADLLEERHGVDYAERYQVWRAWGDLDKPLVILIGGASGVGKTSLAIDLAHLLNIPRVVATDDIRQIMRLTLAPEFMPAIHTSSYSAWSSLRDSGVSDAVIEGYNEQARVVAVGVQAILARCIEENSSVIIDGVHVLSPYIDLSQTRDMAFVAPLCLAVSDRASYSARFAKRALEAPKRRRNRYLDNLDHIMRIQEYLVGRCVQEDIPVIDAEAVEDETSAAVMVVVERLQEQEDVRARLAVNGKNGKAVGKKKKRRRQTEDRSSRPQHGKVRA